MKRIVIAVVILAGCSGEQADTPPTLEILTPQRGAFADDGRVTVTGRVTDDGPVRVTLGGVEVEVAKDGTFTAMTPQLADGITILETHAIDASGNDVRDVRAVLAGTLLPSDGMTKTNIGARLGPAGFDAVGDALATAAEDIDFTAAARALNPIYDNGGCLGAKVEITSVSVGNISAGLVPKANAVDTTVTIEDVVVRLDADFKVACIGGSTTITVRSSRARVRDDLGVTLLGDKIKTSLPSPTVTLEGFSVDVGGVPGAIEDLLKGKAREGAEKALTSAIKSKLPPLADTKLAGLLAKPLSVTLLGHELDVEVVPAKVQLTTTGLFVVADTRLVVAGGEGGAFVSTPASIMTLAHDVSDLGLLVADDMPNQLFAGLWAAGVFEQSMSIDAVGPVAALLDDDVRTLDIALSLPPTVTTREALELAVGDLVITARDASGGEVQRFALSLKTTLVATANGSKLTLATTAPTVYAQLIAQSEAVDRPLADAQIEGIVTSVWGLVDRMLNDALAKVQLPVIAGVAVEAPAVNGRDGYLVFDVGIR